MLSQKVVLASLTIASSLSLQSLCYSSYTDEETEVGDELEAQITPTPPRAPQMPRPLERTYAFNYGLNAKAGESVDDFMKRIFATKCTASPGSTS